MITALFVYGTLRPGDVRWHLLEPFAADEGVDDAVTGLLYDTGLGYPAAVFGTDGDGRADPLPGVVRGRRYELRTEVLDEALRALDTEEHSVAGGYHRVVVTTHSGRAAWAYAYGSGLDLVPIPCGDWLA